MTPEEYAAAQALITAAAVSFTYQFGSMWAQAPLSVAQWLMILQFLWPEVQAKRTDAARLARQFYDSQRLIYHPELPRNDVPLEGNDFPTFVKTMEPVRLKMMQKDSPKDAVTRLSLQVAKEVENAGRRQIIHAVEADTELQRVVEQAAKEQPKKSPEKVTGIIRGWARVATGQETCAWCLMLVSRGPVYSSAANAGFRIDDRAATQAVAAGEDLTDFMDQWHAGCDCKVVPVFRKQDWPGQEAADKALELWKQACRDADKFIEENPDRVHLTGKKKGQRLTYNEEVILALRRRLERGEIDPSEFAAFAA